MLLPHTWSQHTNSSRNLQRVVHIRRSKKLRSHHFKCVAPSPCVLNIFQQCVFFWLSLQDSQGRLQPGVPAALDPRSPSSSMPGAVPGPHTGSKPGQTPQPPGSSSQQQQQPPPQQQRNVIKLPALQQAVPAGGVIELLVPSAGGVTGVVYTLPAGTGTAAQVGAGGWCAQGVWPVCWVRCLSCVS